jgi:hypothetical protein
VLVGDVRDDRLGLDAAQQKAVHEDQHEQEVEGKDEPVWSSGSRPACAAGRARAVEDQADRRELQQLVLFEAPTQGAQGQQHQPDGEQAGHGEDDRDLRGIEAQ